MTGCVDDEETVIPSAARDLSRRTMTYFGLPYIHAVFDVAAWLASMTVFWLGTRHLLPAAALPANRVHHPGAYAVAAGLGAPCPAMVLRTTNPPLAAGHALGLPTVRALPGHTRA